MVIKEMDIILKIEQIAKTNKEIKTLLTSYEKNNLTY